jgi:hypothetical protein
VIVILASRNDELAQSLITRWQPYDAVLLTCADLSVRGWRDSLGLAASTAVVGGREIAQEEIRGVLTRVPGIFEQELLHIISADRAYVAAEMTAFLTSWLSRLACPILNRPTPTSLSGPYWRPEQWTAVAARLGIPVCPVQRHVALASAGAPMQYIVEPGEVSVTIVGDRCFGSGNEEMMRHASRLAQAVKVNFLTVHFSSIASGALFLRANVWPDLSSDEIADAVIAYFHQPPRK